MVTVSDTPALTRGHKKKARTRQLLLGTAVGLLAERGEGFSVGELVARAGVSPGTFYNHFADREQLLAALVPHLVERFAARLAAEVNDPDPAVRFARITAAALDRVLGDTAAVKVALRLDAFTAALMADGPLAYLRRDLADGHAAGRFADPPDDATLDVVMGALTLAARRISDGERTPDYRRRVISQVLRSLGVEAGEAARLADDAVARAAAALPQPVAGTSQMVASGGQVTMAL